MSAQATRPLAFVTGASSGIGYNLTRIAAQKGYDLIVAADQPLTDAVADFGSVGATVQSIQVNLARQEGIDQLLGLAAGRGVDAVMANAGHGLGGALLEQNFAAVEHVINTTFAGTVHLLQQVGRKRFDTVSNTVAWCHEKPPIDIAVSGLRPFRQRPAPVYGLRSGALRALGQGWSFNLRREA